MLAINISMGVNTFWDLFTRYFANFIRYFFSSRSKSDHCRFTLWIPVAQTSVLSRLPKSRCGCGSSRESEAEVERLISRWLVGGLEHFLIFHRLGLVTPTDELTFFRGVGIPPTRWCFWQWPSSNTGHVKNLPSGFAWNPWNPGWILTTKPHVPRVYHQCTI